MKTLVTTVLLALSLAVFARAQAPLSEVLRLKAENQQLFEKLHLTEIQFAQCRANAAETQAKLDSAVLTVQADNLKNNKTALDKELLKAYDGHDGDTIDWSTDPPSLKKKGTKQ